MSLDTATTKLTRRHLMRATGAGALALGVGLAGAALIGTKLASAAGLSPAA